MVVASVPPFGQAIQAHPWICEDGGVWEVFVRLRGDVLGDGSWAPSQRRDAPLQADRPRAAAPGPGVGPCVPGLPPEAQELLGCTEGTWGISREGRKRG